MDSAIAALERLRGSARPRVLFVSHGEAGGVAKHVADLARSIEQDVEVLLLHPSRDGILALRWLRGGETLALFVDAATEWAALVELLRAVGIDRVHLHHVHGLPQAVLALPEALGCAHDVTLHDYFAACPNYHMLDGSRRYCARDPACDRCLDAGPAQWPLSIDEWRAAFAPLLASAARVIAPSKDTARRISAFFPGVAPLVWPHPEPDTPRVPRAVRVLVPGALSLAKGLEVLEACAADAAARDLALHFRVLGFVARPLATWPAAPLSIAGEFPDGTLEEVIAHEGGDVCFFPAQCPEVFSYTLSAALDSGLPLVVTGIGALPERVAGRANAHVVAWNASAAQINDALLAAAPREAPQARARGRMSFEVYRERYLDGISRGATSPSAQPPRIEPRWLEEPRAPADRRPLAFFYEDGVVCGRASSLAGLRRYAFDPDSLHAATDARVLELIEALDRERREGERLRAEAAKKEGRGSPIAAMLRALARRFDRAKD